MQPASLSLPLRPGTGSRRSPDGRTAGYLAGYAPPSPAEAIDGEPPVADRLIVGVDFGTTFSG